MYQRRRRGGGLSAHPTAQEHYFTRSDKGPNSESIASEEERSTQGEVDRATENLLDCKKGLHLGKGN